MNMSSPLHILTDLLPARVRRYVHGFLTAGFTLLTLYLAAQGDWQAFLTGLATVYTARNTQNTFEVSAVDESLLGEHGGDDDWAGLEEIELKG